MAKYISSLRGINISGKNKIHMEALRKLYENIGFTDVSSYIQSGNLIFNTPQKPQRNFQAYPCQQRYTCVSLMQYEWNFSAGDINLAKRTLFLCVVFFKLYMITKPLYLEHFMLKN